jgi:DNA-binding NtrC family response regulator
MPVRPRNLPADAAALANGESRNGEFAHGDGASTRVRDRASSPASDFEPTLNLAGISLAELEKAAITQTLQKFEGNRTRAARTLGISVRTLQRKLRMWRNAKRIATG